MGHRLGIKNYNPQVYTTGVGKGVVNTGTHLSYTLPGQAQGYKKCGTPNIGTT